MHSLFKRCHPLTKRVVILTAFIIFAPQSFTSAATSVYYSVGSSTATQLMTGSPTVTVSGNTATFSVAQSGNIGVGDVVIYGSPSRTAYVSRKLSTDGTQWSLVTATGTTPIATTTATVASIKRAFASLSAAISGSNNASHMNTSNLVTGNYVLNISCYYDGSPDTTSLVVPNSYVTRPSNYINIFTPISTSTQANLSQRHTGKWTSTAYQLVYTGSAAGVIDIYANYTRITGLQIRHTPTNNYSRTIRMDSMTGSGGYVVLDSNIIDGRVSGRTNPEGIGQTSAAANPTVVVTNNIIYGFNNGNSGGTGITVTSGTGFIYNNTVWNSYNSYGFGWNSGTVIYLKNNIAQNDTTGYYSGGATIDPSSTNNLSGHSDAPGSNPITSAAVVFASIASTTVPDLHVSLLDTFARGQGANLSADANYPFYWDVDNQTRSGSGSWSVGADEYIPVSFPRR